MVQVMSSLVQPGVMKTSIARLAEPHFEQLWQVLDCVARERRYLVNLAQLVLIVWSLTTFSP